MPAISLQMKRALTVEHLKFVSPRKLWRDERLASPRRSSSNFCCEQKSDNVQSIDTLPLPVCTYTRGGFRDKRFPSVAEFGHCAAKKLDYYGFKLGLRIARSGMITHFPLLSARDHDTQHLGSLIEGFSGIVPADKGFLDAYGHELWNETQQTQVVTANRKNMESSPEQVKVVKKTK